MTDSEKSMGVLLGHLENLANQSLSLWEVPDDASARLINVSENATYLVEGSHWKSILRIHRENYHSHRAIECELEWSKALTSEGRVITPDFYTGRNGDPIQSGVVEGLPSPRYMVMFHFVEGQQPDEGQDLVRPFEELGQIAAITHLHSIQWHRPKPFERLVWNLDTVFGAHPTWGNWRDGPNVTPEIRKVLEQVENTVTARLTDFGAAPGRYGLIHADMRLANLLIDGTGTRLIDFDDCGLGWYLYDFAASISFMEDSAQVPALKESWVRGYRRIRALPEEDVREIDTFIMLRRLALLAWIGSHIEAPEPRELAPHFARVSAELGSAYLAGHG
ncbi:MAG: phosphotransferase [Gammaproteobacteria bacterium]|nr:phosphotransferase [Gammaproteobacteria bacterium]